MPRRTRATFGVAGAAAVAAVVLRRRYRPRVNPTPVPEVRPVTVIHAHRAGMRLWLQIIAGVGVIGMPAPPDYFRTSWFTGFTGLAQAVLSIAGFIMQPVVNLVNSVFDFIGGVIYNVWRDIATLSGWLYDAAGDFAHAVYRLPFDILEIVNSVVESALSVVTRSLSELWGYVNSIADNLWAYVAGPAEALFNMLIGPVKDWVMGLLGDVLDFLADPIGFLTDIIGRIINEILDAFLDALMFAGSVCAQIVDTGLSFALGIAGSALAVLKKVWSILEWLADLVTDLGEDAIKDAIRTLVDDGGDAIVSTTRSVAGPVEDLITDVFGL